MATDKFEESSSDEMKIQRLKEFALMLRDYKITPSTARRSAINQKKSSIRRIIIEAGAHHTYTIAPPPAVGGLIQRDFDPFDGIFDPPYGMDVIAPILDSIDVAIGSIQDGVFSKVITNIEIAKDELRAGYAFVAMSIDPSNRDLDDVLDAIKIAAKDLGIEAERIDDQESNTRITDRIFEAIRVAQFVIVDVTGARPNVFYEAGYAQGIGKIPIFLAKQGTKIEFDIKDYPIIFYDNMRSLREGLKARLRAVAKGSL
ncbi:hypothetical protein [Mesorhizobium sp. M0491]|uniref:hypothetical protein n=1 Tax=Mesorhizobium sp. M0491 TaxID=2956950 RepID=UPI0033398ECF